MRLFRRYLNRRAVAVIEAERHRLAMCIIRSADQPHPHTQGMYEGLNYALSALEGDR